MTSESEFEEAFNAAEAADRQEQEVHDLRNALRQANSRLAKAKVTSEAVAEAALLGAKSAVLAQEPPKVEPYRLPASRKGTAKAEVALAHLTDWQGSKRTTSYNSEVMRERVHRFLANSMKLVEIQRADHPVNDIVVMLGGDMIEGLFNFPTQPYEIDATLFDQFVTVATLLNEVARYYASRFHTVRFIAEWGNHGRIGSKRAAVPKADNADRMTYVLAESMTKDLQNVSWDITWEDIQRVEIGNYRALLIHGDEVGRNGYASPATIVKHVTAWKSGSYRLPGKPGVLGEKWPFRDAYMGHYHTHAQWPLADGEGNLFQTGSIESDNRYAMENLAATATPSQRLHFIDPRKGRVTAQYQVWVDE